MLGREKEKKSRFEPLKSTSLPPWFSYMNCFVPEKLFSSLSFFLSFLSALFLSLWKNMRKKECERGGDEKVRELKNKIDIVNKLEISIHSEREREREKVKVKERERDNVVCEQDYFSSLPPPSSSLYWKSSSASCSVYSFSPNEKSSKKEWTNKPNEGKNCNILKVLGVIRTSIQVNYEIYP